MRERRSMKQKKFNLDLNNSQHKQLNDYLSKLAKTGKATDWITDTLFAAMPREGNIQDVSTPQVPEKYMPSTSDVPKLPEHTDVTEVKPKLELGPMIRSQGPYPTFTNKTPNDVIRQRKDQAQAKFATKDKPTK